MSRFSVFILTAGTLLAQGDVTRGKAIFDGKGDCLSCHRVNANGSRSGPELTEIGGRRGSTRQYLERALLDPDADVAPANRGVRVTLKKDGATVTGRLLHQDSFTLQMMDGQGKLRSFLKSELRETSIVTKGLMPSFQGKLSPQEVADVVSYLASLQGFGKR